MSNITPEVRSKYNTDAIANGLNNTRVHPRTGALMYQDVVGSQGNGMYTTANPYAVGTASGRLNAGVNVGAGVHNGLGSLGVLAGQAVDNTGQLVQNYGVGGNLIVTDKDIVNASAGKVTADNYDADTIAAGYQHMGRGWGAGINAQQANSQYGRNTNVNAMANYGPMYAGLGAVMRDGRDTEVNATAGLRYKF